MAISTLSLCYKNHAVFTGTHNVHTHEHGATPCMIAGVVKMRRGEAAKVFYEVQTFGDVCRNFQHFVERILSKTDNDDPTADAVQQVCRQIEQACSAPSRQRHSSTTLALLCTLGLIALVCFLATFFVR